MDILKLSYLDQLPNMVPWYTGTKCESGERMGSWCKKLFLSTSSKRISKKDICTFKTVSFICIHGLTSAMMYTGPVELSPHKIILRKCPFMYWEKKAKCCVIFNMLLEQGQE